MGQRLLEVNAQFISGLLMGFTETVAPRYFEVTANPVPPDAKIVSITQSQYRSDNVEIVLSSPSWSDEPPRTRLNPFMQVVNTVPKGACQNCGKTKLHCAVCNSHTIDCRHCGRSVQR
jgi:hypothetical protein